MEVSTEPGLYEFHQEKGHWNTVCTLQKPERKRAKRARLKGRRSDTEATIPSAMRE